MSARDKHDFGKRSKYVVSVGQKCVESASFAIVRQGEGRGGAREKKGGGQNKSVSFVCLAQFVDERSAAWTWSRVRRP